MPTDFEAEHMTGKIHETHPNERQYALGKCYQRGYHLGQANGIGGFGSCVDCSAPGAPGGLTFKDVSLEPDRRPVHTEIPDVLTHNPDAGFAELMAARMETAQERDARVAGTKEPEVTVTQKQAMAIGIAYLSQQKTRENIIKWCGELGLTLVDPQGQSGPHLAMTAEMEGLRRRAESAELKVKDLQGQLADTSDAADVAQRRAQELEAKLDAYDAAKSAEVPVPAQEVV